VKKVLTDLDASGSERTLAIRVRAISRGSLVDGERDTGLVGAKKRPDIRLDFRVTAPQRSNPRRASARAFVGYSCS